MGQIGSRKKHIFFSLNWNNATINVYLKTHDKLRQYSANKTIQNLVRLTDPNTIDVFKIHVETVSHPRFCMFHDCADSAVSVDFLFQFRSPFRLSIFGFITKIMFASLVAKGFHIYFLWVKLMPPICIVSPMNQQMQPKYIISVTRFWWSFK